MIKNLKKTVRNQSSRSAPDEPTDRGEREQRQDAGDHRWCSWIAAADLPPSSSGANERPSDVIFLVRFCFAKAKHFVLTAREPPHFFSPHTTTPTQTRTVWRHWYGSAPLKVWCPVKAWVLCVGVVFPLQSVFFYVSLQTHIWFQKAASQQVRQSRAPL